MATTASADTPRAQFERDGFYTFSQVLSVEMVASLTDASNRCLDQQDAAHFEAEVAAGSMILIDWQFFNREQVFADLVADPNVCAALGELGFHQPRFGHGLGPSPDSGHNFGIIAAEKLRRHNRHVRA